MDNLNFVPCVRFVKRGVAKANPEKVQLSEEELKAVINKAKQDINDAQANLDTDDSDESGDSSDAEEMTDECPKNVSTTQQGELSGATERMDADEFNFEDYDKEEDRPNALLGIENLAIFENDTEDSYFTQRNRNQNGEDSDSEAEDDIIKPDDNLILVGHVESDASILEVYVYNEKEGSLYVHHDMLLPSFPLCIEWMNYDPTNPSPGNLCAIGTMEPVIDVWDLDIIDCLEPAFKLGSKKKKIGHKDAVLDIAWNQNFHHVLASGSVDKTVLLWDLDSGEVHTKLDPFTDKVQSLCWHPLEAQTLLVGGCDGLARVFDCRQAEGTHKSWSLSGEIERIAWDPMNPFCFLAGTNEGIVSYIDCRNEKILWDVKAHEKEVTGLSISKQCPGLMVTSSSDGFIKTWDTAKGNAQLVSARDMKLGDIQCLCVCPESPFVVCSGGDNKSNNFGVWDLRTQDAVAEQFGSRQLEELHVETA